MATLAVLRRAIPRHGFHLEWVYAGADARTECGWAADKQDDADGGGSGDGDGANDGDDYGDGDGGGDGARDSSDDGEDDLVDITRADAHAVVDADRLAVRRGMARSRRAASPRAAARLPAVRSGAPAVRLVWLLSHRRTAAPRT